MLLAWFFSFRIRKLLLYSIKWFITATKQSLIWMIICMFFREKFGGVYCLKIGPIIFGQQLPKHSLFYNWQHDFIDTFFLLYLNRFSIGAIIDLLVLSVIVERNTLQVPCVYFTSFLPLPDIVHQYIYLSKLKILPE